MNNKIFLCAPVNALVEGLYEQNVLLSEIRRHGDFGLGTFNELDGEMVMLDGIIYRVDELGQVHVITDDIFTPFACVTNFTPVTTDSIPNELSNEAFLDSLFKMMPSQNIFYAFKISGSFSYIKTRSVPKQENYRPLVDVTKDQPEFDFENIDGTIVGFYTPAFLSSINVPGMHLHFISADKKFGGHLLKCTSKNVKVEIQFLNTMELSLPLTLDYLTLDFTRNTNEDLDKAEK